MTRFASIALLQLSTGCPTGVPLPPGGELKVIPSLILGLGLALPTASVAQDNAFAGPHLGVFFGYGWGEKVWDLNDAFAPRAVTTHPVAGGLAGLEAGIRFSHGPLIWGFEAGLGWSGVNGSATCLLNSFDGTHGEGDVSSYTCMAEINWLSTATGQFGIASGNVLVYVEAGVALADETFGTYVVYEPVTVLNAGWLVGAGATLVSNSGLYFRVEYNFINFGTYTLPLYNNVGPVPVELSQNVHLVTFGIGRQF